MLKTKIGEMMIGDHLIDGGKDERQIE